MDGALILGGRPVLKHGGNRDDKETSEETEPDETADETSQTDAGDAQRYSTQGQTGCPDGDKPVFNPTPGRIACGDAAETDAEREGECQVGVLGFAQPEHVLGVDDEVHLHQGSDEEEAGVSPSGPPEIAIHPHEAQARPEVGHGIDARGARRIGRRHGGNPAATEPTKHRQGGKEEAGEFLSASEGFRQKP